MSVADALRSIIGIAIIVGLIAVVLILTDLWKVSPGVRANVGKGAMVAFLLLVFWFFVALVS